MVLARPTSCRGSQRDYFIFLMRKLTTTVFVMAMAIIVFSGCASPKPSPEQQTRESEQQLDAEHQQAEFRKALPPVSNPGRGNQ
ncbi:MAG TPA: hypothetical protein VH227_06930 [Candidatus Udaeobacter sp.]|jgi:hypothetical protein|nr:hypothetical protein [Candidatus Udaeobacter sp.]